MWELMLTDINKIERMCRTTMDLFEWSAVPLGHLLRNHAYSYRDWGIEITIDNVEELRSRSKFEYRHEWAPSDESLNQLIAEASVRAGISDVNKLMNAKVGQYTADHVSKQRAGLNGQSAKTRIVEIGTGAGGTMLAALRKMREAGIDLSTIELTLIEPSAKRLQYAQNQFWKLFRELNIDAPQIKRKEGTVEVLKGMESEWADVVIQNAAIHHESFKDHLSDIYRILKPGMPFISGDWHEGTYETPARIYWMYMMLQDPLDDEVASRVLDFTMGKSAPEDLKEKEELGEFRRMFHLDDQALKTAYAQYTDSERRASVGGMRYWLEVAKIFKDEGKKSPEVVIQGHERVALRTMALANAGFTFDHESRLKYVEVVKERGFGELGAVMYPKKAQR